MNGGPYRDRWEAGRAVADRLSAYLDLPGVLVLGLPRGGLPVAAEVAQALSVPLDVLIVRKIGMPQHPEFAMGAIAAIAGRIETVQNPNAIAQLDQQSQDGEVFEEVAAREREELKRRQQAYRDDRAPIEIANRTVILVDDGLATGSTMRAAIAVVKQEHPARLIAAVPVGSREACDEIRELVDELVCPWTPEPFWAVGQGYESFPQTTDDEVRQILRSANRAGDE